jgi:hypothetical protein
VDWNHVAQSWVKRRALMNILINIRVKKGGVFLYCLSLLVYKELCSLEVTSSGI